MAVAAALMGSLAACGSISERVTEQMSDLPVVGLPAGAPARPTQVSYPAVHEGVSPRSGALLNSAQQQKIEDDLVAAGNRQRTSIPADWQPEAPPAARPAAGASRSAGAVPPAEARAGR